MNLNQSTQQACNDLINAGLIVDGRLGTLSNAAISNLLQKLQDIFKTNGYVWSTNNLIGIRMSEVFTDEFTDYGVVVMSNALHAFPISTKPGSSFLSKPEDPAKGTACLQEGQYSGMWQFHNTTEGWSGDPYCQQVAPCTVLRQKGKTVGSNIDRTAPDHGTFGINFHSWKNFNGPYVKNLSAGCQVMDQDVLVDEILSYIEGFTNPITYTLLNRTQF